MHLRCTKASEDMRQKHCRMSSFCNTDSKRTIWRIQVETNMSVRPLSLTRMLAAFCCGVLPRLRKVPAFRSQRLILSERQLCILLVGPTAEAPTKELVHPPLLSSAPQVCMSHELVGHGLVIPRTKLTKQTKKTMPTITAADFCCASRLHQRLCRPKEARYD